MFEFSDYLNDTQPRYMKVKWFNDAGGLWGSRGGYEYNAGGNLVAYVDDYGNRHAMFFIPPTGAQKTVTFPDLGAMVTASRIEKVFRASWYYASTLNIDPWDFMDPRGHYPRQWGAIEFDNIEHQHIIRIDYLTGFAGGGRYVEFSQFYETRQAKIAKIFASDGTLLRELEFLPTGKLVSSKEFDGVSTPLTEHTFYATGSIATRKYFIADSIVYCSQGYYLLSRVGQQG